MGHLDEAERELELGRSLALAGRQRSLAAGALTNLSMVALHRGDLERAARLAEERLVVAREMVEPRGRASALSALSGVRMAMGDFEGARRIVVECHELFEQLGLYDGIVASAFNLVILAVRLGDPDEAAREAAALLDDATASGNPAMRLLAVLGVGGLAAFAGRPEGVELIAAAEARGPSQVLDPSDRAWLAEGEDFLAGAIGPGEVAAARARGAALGADGIDAAFALATRTVGVLLAT